MCLCVFTYYFNSLFDYRTCHNRRSKWGKITLSIKTNNFTQSLMSDAHCMNWQLSPQQAPCRKLLTTLISDLEAHLFDTQHDIYMPNCDKRGFFRKKQVSVQGKITVVAADICVCVPARTVWFLCVLLVQCWSSRGKRRGKCWCVDMNGMMVPSKGKQKGSQVC